jgi:anti-sigma B factor antagonist
VYHGAHEAAVKTFRRAVGNVTILSFAGELDSDNLPAAREETDGVIQSGCDRLVFNLGELAFLNSSALAYLITVHKRVKSMGGQLVFSAPSRFFQTTIKHLGLEGEFTVFPDDQAALEHFGQGGAA